MTESGSFIYHGIERVCVPQIQKATGIAFVSTNKQNNITDYVCKIVPSKGTWVEIIVSAKKILYFLFNKKVKILLSDFLKVFGEETQKSLLEIVDIVEEVPCNKKNLEKYIGERIATDIQIKKEIPNGKNKQEKIQKVLNIGDVITAESISNIIESGLKNILVFKCDKETYKKYEPLINTVANMSSEDPQDLALKFYKQFNSGYRGKDKEIALAYIKGILKDEKLFSIEDIGRRKINSIVGFAKEDEFKKTLTPNDFRNIIKYFLDVINGEKQVEDIDHYGNKCLKTIGEQFYDEFYISFLRISRLAKERLNVCDKKNINIYNLINCGIFTSIINQFFATNQYMQFMDELNPLAKIMHKRRISAIGVGGITAESKSTDIRDIHYSQYGKVCPIETPEGQNIGLISALASYAKCDDCGVIITPYRKVINGVIDLDNNHIFFSLFSPFIFFFLFFFFLFLSFFSSFISSNPQPPRVILVSSTRLPLVISLPSIRSQLVPSLYSFRSHLFNPPCISCHPRVLHSSSTRFPSHPPFLLSHHLHIIFASSSYHPLVFSSSSHPPPLTLSSSFHDTPIS